VPDYWPSLTREWSEWHCEAYSREREVEELCGIMDRLLEIEAPPFVPFDGVDPYMAEPKGLGVFLHG